MMLTAIRFILFCFFLACSSLLTAQQNVTSFEVDGLKVILQRDPGEVVATRLYVKGGTANYTIEQQGVEQLAFEMALYGDSKAKKSSEIKDLANSLGIGLSAKSGYDYGYLGATFLKRYWAESWNLWTELIMKPDLNSSDFERVRDELYARNRRSAEVPEQAIDLLSMQHTFVGTDYEKVPQGTEGSLYGLKLEDVQQHYQKVMTKANCYLVIVGDITKDELMPDLLATLGQLPLGTAQEISSINSTSGAGANIQHKDLELNHVQGRTPAPGRYDKDGIVNLLAMQLLSDRLEHAARANRNIDYTPTAVAGSELRFPTNSIYTSTGTPSESLKLMVNTIEKALNDGFSQEELERKKPFYLTLNFLGQENLDAQAHLLGDAEAAGDWRSGFGLTEAVLNMTADDVNRVFREQFEWINWTYLGNLSQVQTEDFQQIERIAEPADSDE